VGNDIIMAKSRDEIILEVEDLKQTEKVLINQRRKAFQENVSLVANLDNVWEDKMVCQVHNELDSNLDEFNSAQFMLIEIRKSIAELERKL
jgi:uncharacterized coiled-coil DUF342 family protein